MSPKRSSLKIPKPEGIELDKNLGTEPYESQERFMRGNFQNPIADDVDELGKADAETSSSCHRCIPIVTERKAFADSDLGVAENAGFTIV